MNLKNFLIVSTPCHIVTSALFVKEFENLTLSCYSLFLSVLNPNLISDNGPFVDIYGSTLPTCLSHHSEPEFVNV